MGALSILLLEDNPGDVRLIQEALADARGPFKVTVVGRLSEAVALIAEKGFDVVLSDLGLPDSQGVTTVTSLRDSSNLSAACPDVPIIVLTGVRNEDLALHALRAGADDYLPKAAIDGDALGRSIRYSIERREVLRQAERSARDAREAGTALHRQVAGLQKLTNTGVRITAASTLPEVLQLIADAASGLVAGATAVVAARDSTTGEIQRAASVGHAPSESARILTMPIGDSAETPHGSIDLVGHSGDLTPSDAAFLSLLAQLADRAVRNVRQIEEIRAAVRAHEELLAIVSHDLINPVGAAYTSTLWMLQEPGLAPEVQHRQLGMIQRSLENVHRLIRDLLDVSRIDAGRLVVDPKPEPVEPIVREAAELLESRALARGISLQTRIEPDLPRVSVERDRMVQVFSNLIGNGIKFAAEGGRVDVTATPEDGWVRFAVTDDGPGIRSADQQHLFDRFWQARRSKRAGAGLGLAIVKGIVDAHGGEIWVESVEGQGSSFCFRVPIAQGALRDLEGEAAVEMPLA